MEAKIFKNTSKYLLIVFLMAPLFVYSQQDRQRFQDQARELESRRIAFLTRELSLTPEEAQVFWPIYNEYNERRNEMMMRHRAERAEMKNMENMSESELLRFADADIRNMEEMTALRRAYHEKFKAVLPVEKVIMLYEAERRFNRQLFREGRPEQRRGRN